MKIIKDILKQTPGAVWILMLSFVLIAYFGGRWQLKSEMREKVMEIFDPNSADNLKAKEDRRKSRERVKKIQSDLDETAKKRTEALKNMIEEKSVYDHWDISTYETLMKSMVDGFKYMRQYEGGEKKFILAMRWYYCSNRGKIKDWDASLWKIPDSQDEVGMLKFYEKFNGLKFRDLMKKFYAYEKSK